MRIYLALILTAISLSFATAYFALNLQQDHFASEEEKMAIQQSGERFRDSHVAVALLDLSSMYPTRDYIQLIQPVTNPLGQAPSPARDCGERVVQMTSGQVSKPEIWEAYRCGAIPGLPEHFFEFSPFIHDSGQSYAYMAFASGLPPFTDLGHVKKNLNFFHVMELHLLPPDILDVRFKVLATFGTSLLEALIRGDSPLLSDGHYLVREKQKGGLFYRAYDRTDFEKFTSAGDHYARASSPLEKCFYREGNLCWQKDSSNLLQMLRPSSILIFGTSLVILTLVSAGLYSRIKQQNLEEERKRHALRVLTHELRTPVANLMLQIEGINRQSDLIAPIVMEGLLKMEGEIYRLKRLAEKSSSYLGTGKGGALMSLDMREIPSFNDLVGSILSDYPDVVFHPLTSDRPAVVDPYWFGICLKNLVENAHHHGAMPIVVTCMEHGPRLCVQVVDQGEIHPKKTRGKGLGLGLEIVARIMGEMQGGLTSSTSPTTFTLFIRSKA